MSKYAFLIHGDEGQYEQISNTIRLRKHGAWTVGEKIQQDRLAKQQARQVLSAVQLAKRIADKENISVEEAFALMQSQGEVSNAMMLSDHLDEVRDIVDGGMSQNEADARIITIFMRTRGEGLVKGKWTGLGDWSEGDTEVLTGDLKDKIMLFINSEQAGGSTLDDDDADEAIAEADGGNEGNSPSGTKQNESASESLNTTTTGTPAMDESPLAA